MRILWARVFLVVLCFTFSAYAQDAPGSSKYQAKIGSERIVQDAQSGISQLLIVDIEPGAIFSDFHKRKKELERTSKQAELGSSAASSETLAKLESDHRANLNEMHARLAERKKAIVAGLSQYGVELVKEYPDSPTMLVLVKDINGLTALLSSVDVKSVNKTDIPLQPSANWPQSYQDLSLIKSSAANSLGYKGANYTVAVLDQPIDGRSLGTLDGSDSSNCYRNPGVAYPLCRLQYQFGTGTNGNLCSDTNQGLPYPASCQWQHGTLDALIVTKVAPGARIDAWNLFDRDGANGTTGILTDDLDALLKIINTGYIGTTQYLGKPYAAVNMSIAIDSAHKYTDYCSASPGASQISQIIAAGVPVIAAAGNKGWTDGVSAPRVSRV